MTLISQKVGDTWVLKQSEQFQYTSFGQLKSHTMSLLKDDQWINSSRLQFEYDSISHLETLRYWQLWKEGEWSSNLRFRPVRDPNDRLIEEKVDKKDESNWLLARKNTSSFSEVGGLKQEQVYLNLNGDDWEFSWKDIYTYNEGKLVKKVGYSWKNGTWAKGMIIKYSYNLDGLRTEELMIRVINGEESNWRRTSFSYKNGLKTFAKLEVSKDGQWVENQLHTFTYLDQKFLIN
ncbi:hypothetical protein BFP97_01600 [Roseivirga sp. 4D4]|nr:hypothetical protein BFP97_01600 [Roseivirga sp. 4D4]